MNLAPQEKRTYFWTSVTLGRRSLFQTDRMASLFLEVLKEQRQKERMHVHEYGVMKEHAHLILTPAYEISLEKAVQFIKGNLSHQAGVMFGLRGQLWQSGSTEEQIATPHYYQRFRNYIHQNPVKAGYVTRAEDYPYSSAHPNADVDPIPKHLRG